MSLALALFNYSVFLHRSFAADRKSDGPFRPPSRSPQLCAEAGVSVGGISLKVHNIDNAALENGCQHIAVETVVLATK